MAACRPPIPPLLAVSVFFLSFFLQDPARAGGDPVLLLPPSLGVSVIFINTLIKMYAKVTLLTYAVTVKTQSIAPLRSTPDVELHSRSRVKSCSSSLHSALQRALHLYSSTPSLQCSTHYSSTLYILSPSLTPQLDAWTWTLERDRASLAHQHLARGTKAAAARAAAASEERGSTTYRERERTKRASRRVQVRCK